MMAIFYLVVCPIWSVVEAMVAGRKPWRTREATPPQPSPFSKDENGEGE